MDKGRERRGLGEPFKQQQTGEGQVPVSGNRVYCMLINYETLDMSLAQEIMAVMRAHPQLTDIEGKQFFRQSGMTDDGFKEMVLREIYPLSKAGHIQNIRSGVPGCVSFDADARIHQSLSDVFPSRKFSLFTRKYALERDEDLDVFKRFLDNRALDGHPEYEFRPYLDS